MSCCIWLSLRVVIHSNAQISANLRFISFVLVRHFSCMSHKYHTEQIYLHLSIYSSSYFQIRTYLEILGCCKSCVPRFAQAPPMRKYRRVLWAVIICPPFPFIFLFAHREGGVDVVACHKRGVCASVGTFFSFERRHFVCVKRLNLTQA